MIEKRSSIDHDVRAPFPLRDFTGLRGLRNIPDPLIEAHLKLYGGYVKNVNLLLGHLERAELGSPEWSEMKRRIGFELNGLRLHELYFENLQPGASGVGRALEEALAAAWGTYKHWKDEFEATGQLRGVGWVILYKDPVLGRLSNHWIGLHEEGHPAGFAPLLVMDVWEHAYTGMDRSRYIDAFFANIRWEGVETRWAGS